MASWLQLSSRPRHTSRGTSSTTSTCLLSMEYDNGIFLMLSRAFIAQLYSVRSPRPSMSDFPNNDLCSRMRGTKMVPPQILNPSYIFHFHGCCRKYRILSNLGFCVRKSYCSNSLKILLRCDMNRSYNSIALHTT